MPRVSLPHRIPNDELVTSHLALESEAWVKTGRWGSKPTHKNVTRGVRLTALHEAGHIVSAILGGCDARSVTIIPDEGCVGRANYVEPRGHVETGLTVRHLLAGIAAESVVTRRRLVLFQCSRRGDLNDLSSLHPNMTQEQLVAAWRATVVFVASPHVWRAILRVAEGLLQHNTLLSDDLYRLVEEDSPRRTSGLNEARAALLKARPIGFWVSENEMLNYRRSRASVEKCLAHA